MKGLFNDVKKESSNAGVFKFSFKLGGEEESEENEPCNSVVKKNKKKKKKKKASTKISETECFLDTDNKEPISDIQISLSQMSISDTISSDLACSPVDIAHSLLSNVEQSKAPEDTVTEKVLSKSQKKNMKRSKAKKAAEQPNIETENIQDGYEKVNNTLKGTKPSVSKQTITSSELTSHNEISSPVKPTGSKASSSKTTSPIRSKSVYVPPTGSGPHFLSAKDPELDEATKQRFRFGMGRNLVAIGPAKVRDPNWLPPPPGLTRKPSISTASTGTGTVVKNTPGSLGGLFSKKEGEGVSAAGKSSAAFIADGPNNAPVVSHSSPFSFSFNGL